MNIMYFALSIPAIIFVLGLYRVLSVCLHQDRTGALTIRVGWSNYVIRRSSETGNLSVYRIDDDFCYDEILVDSKKLETYVIDLVFTHFKDVMPDQAKTKRFLRKFYW